MLIGLILGIYKTYPEHYFVSNLGSKVYCNNNSKIDFKDIILFDWDYMIYYFDDSNTDGTSFFYFYKDSIEVDRIATIGCISFFRLVVGA